MGLVEQPVEPLLQGVTGQERSVHQAQFGTSNEHNLATHSLIRVTNFPYS
jgi:hypothetical protein